LLIVQNEISSICLFTPLEELLAGIINITVMYMRNFFAKAETRI